MGEPIESPSSDSMKIRLLPQIQVLESEIKDLEEKIDYAEATNQPRFQFSNELVEKRAQLSSLKKFIEKSE